MDTVIVEQAFVEAHKEMQDDLGYPGATVGASTTPLGDLKGFSSLLIPNVIRAVARRLGIPPPKGNEIRNIYVSDSGRQKLQISNIAQSFNDRYCRED